jgi:hypothetical protein
MEGISNFAHEKEASFYLLWLEKLGSWRSVLWHEHQVHLPLDSLGHVVTMPVEGKE